MEVKVNQVKSPNEESAVINVSEMTDSIRAAVALLENGEKILIGLKDDTRVPLQMKDIYYIETVDEKSFAYTKSDCYEVKSKLYELEEVMDFRFFRCSKSMILNSRKIKNVKPVENSRMCATLLNGETVVISRSYIKDLKKRLGI